MRVVPFAPVFIGIVVSLSTACEQVDPPVSNFVEVCTAETLARDPLREPLAVVGRAVEPTLTGCRIDSPQLDLEVVNADGARLRVVVIERTLDDQPVGERFDIPLDTDVVVRGDEGFESGQVIVRRAPQPGEDDGAVLFSAGDGMDIAAALIPIGHVRDTGGPFADSCGHSTRFAARFLDGDDAVVVNSGDVITQAGFTVRNVRADRVDVDESQACTDVHDGDFASWILHAEN